MVCHGIFPRAFSQMCSKKQPRTGKKQTMASLVQGIVSELTGGDEAGLREEEPLPAAGNAVSHVDAASAAYVSPELPVSKVQGVRAMKSCAWLERPETPTEVLVSILSTEPLQDLSFWFLKSQKNMGWLSKKPEERPIVNLTSLQFSPVVLVVSETISTLEFNLDVQEPEILLLLDGGLVLRLCVCCVFTPQHVHTLLIWCCLGTAIYWMFYFIYLNLNFSIL